MSFIFRRKYLVQMQIHVSKEQVDLSAKDGNGTKKMYI